MKQQQHYRIVVLHTCMIVLMAGAISESAAAMEVYSWTDKDGIANFSDMPPDELDAQIVEFQKTRLDSSSGADSIAGKSRSAADEKREKIAADRTQRRETRAEVERMCAQHRKRLARIEPHRRVYYKNKDGKTVRMDDAQRIARVKESRKYIAKNCG